MGYVRGPEVSVELSSRHGPVKIEWVGNVRLGGLLALRASDRFDGAERAVEPGLLGGLHLIESQTQVVLQVLNEEEQQFTAWKKSKTIYQFSSAVQFESSVLLIITPSKLLTEHFVAVRNFNAFFSP